MVDAARAKKKDGVKVVLAKSSRHFSGWEWGRWEGQALVQKGKRAMNVAQMSAKMSGRSVSIRKGAAIQRELETRADGRRGCRITNIPSTSRPGPERGNGGSIPSPLGEGHQENSKTSAQTSLKPPLRMCLRGSEQSMALHRLC